MLLGEADAAQYEDVIAHADRRRMAAPSWLEAAVVLDRRADVLARGSLDAFVERLRISVEPLTAVHAAIARRAWRDYGRGSGHPARLNFGDCLAYGFAKGEREPLLFKGNDFIHTDIEPAMKA